MGIANMPGPGDTLFDARGPSSWAEKLREGWFTHGYWYFIACRGVSRCVLRCRSIRSIRIYLFLIVFYVFSIVF